MDISLKKNPDAPSVSREEQIFQEADKRYPRRWSGDAENINNLDVFIEGAEWSDKNPSEELIKKILELAWEYAASDPEVNNLTEEGELEYVKNNLNN